jgi:hypothetical protein
VLPFSPIDDDDDDIATAPIRIRPPAPTMPPPPFAALPEEVEFDVEPDPEPLAAADVALPPPAKLPTMQLNAASVSPEQMEYARILRRAWSTPFEPSVYKELYGFAVAVERFDLAWRALDVLMVVGAPNRDQVAWLLENPPPELSAIPECFQEDAWSLLGAGGRDPVLTSLLGWTGAAWARAAVTRGMESGRRPTVHPGLTGSHSNLSPFLHETTERGAKLFGLTPPSLLVGGLQGPPFSLALDPWGALLVSLPSADARGEALYFDLLVALAYLRADLTLAALAPTADALRSHVRAALDRSPELLAFIDPSEQEPVNQILVHAARDWAGKLPDVETWLATSREVALRGAVTLCGSVQDAQMALGGVHNGTGHPALARLFPWFVGAEHGELRKRLKVALPGPDATITL